NDISEVDKSLFGLWNEYNILMAKSTCVTLTFPSTINGKPHCMIWGIRSGEKIEENDCYNSSYSTCALRTSFYQSKMTLYEMAVIPQGRSDRRRLNGDNDTRFNAARGYGSYTMTNFRVSEAYREMLRTAKLEDTTTIMQHAGRIPGSFNHWLKLRQKEKIFILFETP
ncbi:hypothetical protein MRX96_051745, partial [Rhipicephalus microplus]